nr:MAG TPA: hypothetical protein [Caudoviricetes sp.]
MRLATDRTDSSPRGGQNLCGGFHRGTARGHLCKNRKSKGVLTPAGFTELSIGFMCRGV